MLKFVAAFLFTLQAGAVELTINSAVGYDPSLGRFSFDNKSFETSNGTMEKQDALIDALVIEAYLKAGGKLKWPDNLENKPAAVDKAIGDAVSSALNNLRPSQARAIINDLRAKLKSCRKSLMTCPTGGSVPVPNPTTNR